MGYKRAGFRVIGNCEIDPRMNEIYVKNNHPKYNYQMDLRDFNNLDNLPDELYNLDILDGSPPCSTFSTAGSGEKVWGKARAFREGQKTQTLDDLFFVFLDTVEKLKPKIVVAENVTGLLKGNAKGYVNEIIKRFHSAGYEVQIFKLNAAKMNVPQARERVFFIANNQNFKKIKLQFNEKPILFGEVRSETGDAYGGTVYQKYIDMRKKGDRTVLDVKKRIGEKPSGFNHTICFDDEIHQTLCASGFTFRGADGKLCCKEDIINISSFPQDYDFGKEKPKYVCGMCVPPNMMANIANELWKQWLQK